MGGVNLPPRTFLCSNVLALELSYSDRIYQLFCWLGTQYQKLPTSCATADISPYCLPITGVSQRIPFCNTNVSQPGYVNPPTMFSYIIEQRLNITQARPDTLAVMACRYDTSAPDAPLHAKALNSLFTNCVIPAYKSWDKDMVKCNGKMRDGANAGLVFKLMVCIVLPTIVIAGGLGIAYSRWRDSQNQAQYRPFYDANRQGYGRLPDIEENPDQGTDSDGSNLPSSNGSPQSKAKYRSIG
jgi:hypothetical protein